MWKCRKYLVVPLVWITINLIDGKPQPHASRQAANSPPEAVTAFSMFRPQIPTISEKPKCAGNFTFCEHIDSYPYAHLKYILERNSSSYRYIFNKEEVKEELIHRQSPESSFVCRSIIKTVFPKIGKNKNNKWKFIINQDNYLQGVRVETCYNPEGPCDIIGEVSNEFALSCRQKYIYTKLLSLSNKGHPTIDVFRIPSACCCAYRRNTAFLKQFGASATSPNFMSNSPS